MTKTLKVVVTSGSGKIAYSLASGLCSGSVFGAETHIKIVLIDKEANLALMQELKNEIEELNNDLVDYVEATHLLDEAFTDVDYVILADENMHSIAHNSQNSPQPPSGEDLAAILDKFAELGQALNKYAPYHAKILVVTDKQANSSCLVCMKHAPRLSPKNFTCLSQVDLNHFKKEILLKLEESSSENSTNLDRNVTIFGSLSRSMIPWMSENCPPMKRMDEKTFTEIRKNLKTHKLSNIEAQTNCQNAIKIAQAICDHLKDWHLGTPEGKWSTMGVYFEDNPYQFEQCKVFSSCPVTIDSAGKWEFVKDIKIMEPERRMIEISLEELRKEREEIIELGIW